MDVMAKTPSEKLYNLVQALSPAEKRYFRIFVRGKTIRATANICSFSKRMASHGPALDEEALKSKNLQKSGR